MKNTRISKAIAVVFVSILLVCSAFAQRGGQNIALLLDTNRDFTGNITATDRTWFYLNQNGTPKPAGDGIYPSIEVSDDGIPSNDIDKAVYVRGSSITLVVTLKTYTNNPDSVNGTLSLSDAKFVTSGTEYACSISGPATVSVPGSGGTQNITLTFTGLPNFVAKGQLKFKSFVTLTTPSNGQPTGHIAWGTSASSVLWPSTIYLTDQTPTGLQTVPWTDLLDLTCTWAHGYSGLTDVRFRLAFGLYWNGNRWNYSGSGVWFWKFGGQYDLKGALNSPALGGNMDCRDFSGFYVLAAASQGHAAHLTILEGDYSGLPGGLKTNHISGSGNDATQFFTYTRTTWNFHQVAVLSGIVDAAAAHWLTPSGVTYKNPPAGWSLSNYWQVQNVTSYGDFHGLAYGPIASTSPTALSVHQSTTSLVGIWNDPEE